MKIGHQTHPRKDLIREIQWIGANGFDFVDLFLEPDKGEVPPGKVTQVRRALSDSGLEVVGHTAWYLPIGSPFRELRETAVSIIKRYLCIFEELGCRKVTVHGNWHGGLFTEKEAIAFQTESLRELAAFAGRKKIRILYEPVGSRQETVKTLRTLLTMNPDIGYHADTGHLNLFRGSPIRGLAEFRDRLSHIHMHDNDGQRDLHLPMGTGTIPWDPLIKELKSFYDGTITLEIFSADKDYVLLAKKKLEDKWRDL
jgi:sugar phosphate isomerase/epimerase